jgi:hypothetical protein
LILYSASYSTRGRVVRVINLLLSTGLYASEFQILFIYFRGSCCVTANDWVNSSNITNWRRRVIVFVDKFRGTAQHFCGRINRLTPNDLYMRCTALLTSKRCSLYIYSTNVGTEYFKHAVYSPFFSLQNAVCFITLTCLVPVLFTFYTQVCWN